MDSRRSSTDSSMVDLCTRIPPRSPSKPEFLTKPDSAYPSGAGRGRTRKPRPRDILFGGQGKASNQSFNKASSPDSSSLPPRRGADLSPTLPMMPKESSSRQVSTDMDSAKLPSGALSTDVSLPSAGDVVEKRKLEKTISDLQSELQSVSSKLSEVTTARDSLAQAATCFESEKAICQTSTETYSKVVIESAKELGKLHQRIEQLEAEGADKDLEIVRLLLLCLLQTGKITEMQEDLDHAAQLTEEYEELRRDFDELQAAHEDAQRMLDDAKLDCDQARQAEQQACEKLTSETKRLKADIDHAQGLAAAFMEEHKTLEAKHKEMTARAVDLEEQLAAATDAHSALSEVHAALSTDHEKLQVDADKALDAAAAIQTDLDEQRGVVADLKAELEAVQAELAKNRDALAAAHAAADKAAAEVAQLKEAQKLLEDSVEDLQNQLQAAQLDTSHKSSELEDLQRRLDKSQREAAEGREALDVKERDLKQTLALLSACQQDKETVEAQAAKNATDAEALAGDLTSKYEEKDREVVGVRALLATADEALTARESLVATLKTHEASLTEKLDASQANISELEERMTSMRNTSDSLQEQLLATEDRVREAAAETVTWKDRADTFERELSTAHSQLADISREREFLASRLQERELEVQDLKEQVSGLQVASKKLHEELNSERGEVSRLQTAAREASGRLTTSLAEACAAVARAEAAEAATSAVEGEKAAAEEEVVALGDRAEDLAAECSELNIQCKEAEAFIYEHLYQCWLTATRAILACRAPPSATDCSSPSHWDRDPLTVLSENAPPDGPPNSASPMFAPQPPRPPSGRASTGALRAPSDNGSASKRLSLNSLDGKRSNGTLNDEASLQADAWAEFEATAIATANVESSGPQAWRALAAAVQRLHAEASVMSAKKLESSRTMAAQEVAFIKTECAKELAVNEKLIEDLSEALDTRGAEAEAALAAHERARQAIAQRDSRETRVAAALARADAQTHKLEALCLRTERANSEHVSMLQRSVRDLRARCESLRQALSEERGTLAAVAVKADALATRERVARGAETEATAEASDLAAQLAHVREEYATYRTTNSAKRRGPWQRAGAAVRSVTVAAALTAAGIHAGARRPSLAGK